MNLNFLRGIKKRKLFLTISIVLNLLFGVLKPAFAQNKNHPTNIEKLVANNNILYKMKDHPRLIAEALKLNHEVQLNIKNLILQLSKNSFEPTAKIEQIDGLKNVFSLNNENEGILFFRKKNNFIEILGQSNSFDKTKIIDLLKEFDY